MKTEKFIYINVTSPENVEPECSSYMSSIYSTHKRVLQKKRKEKLKLYLTRLLKQRKQLDSLISSIQKQLKINTEDSVTDKYSDDMYVTDIYDSIFKSVGDQLAFIIFDIIDTGKEAKCSTRPKDLNVYFQYRFSKEIGRSLSEHYSDIAKNAPKYWSFYADNTHAFNRIYLMCLADRTKGLYQERLENEELKLTASDVCAKAFNSMLSRHIFYWRQENSVTQSALARECGVERTTIVNIERLRQPASMEKVIKILNATGASLMILPISNNQ